MNAKIFVFVICIEAIIYLLLYNLDDCTFKEHIQKENNNFNTKAASVGQISKIITVKLAVRVIESHLSNIINNDLSNNAFSDSAKLAPVRPIYKKDHKNEIKHYRPVRILNCFSKIY